jgi:hypothetical protein
MHAKKKAWMDEAMMNVWIDLVSIPWRNTWDPDIVPLRVLDAYCVDMKGSIVNRIQALGIEVQHISGGYTYLCQPVDVGINHSIKKEILNSGREWMINGGGVEDGVAKPPARRQVAEWIIGTYKSITEQAARNAWKKIGYKWFLDHWIKCYDLLKFNYCCLAKQRRQFCHQRSRDCSGTGVSLSCLDCPVEEL